MDEHGLHPVSARVVDSLSHDEETGEAVFRPSLEGLEGTLADLEPMALGQVMHELADLVLRLLDDPELRGLADELGLRLNRPDYMRVYQEYLTCALKKERDVHQASAAAFGRFRGGQAPTSSTRFAPRSQLLMRVPVRG